MRALAQTSCMSGSSKSTISMSGTGATALLFSFSFPTYRRSSSMLIVSTACSGVEFRAGQHELSTLSMWKRSACSSSMSSTVSRKVDQAPLATLLCGSVRSA